MHRAFYPFAIAALALPALVLAQPSGAESGTQGKGQKFAERFKKADTNGDGKLTKDEANGKMPRVYENFDAIDKNKKGYVTLQEIMAYGTERSASRPQTR